MTLPPPSLSMSQQPHRRPSKGSTSSQPSRPLAESSQGGPQAGRPSGLSSGEASGKPEASRLQPSFPPLSQSPAPPVFRIPGSPRSASQDPHPAKAAKVAIPRLKRSSDGGSERLSRSGGRHRVNHACEPCRHRKTKCSGERPVCRHCQDFKITCYYADGKRDRVKKCAQTPLALLPLFCA